VAADYRFTKRFDAYFGAMANGVQDGLANGYLVRNTIDPTLGIRYRF
jgi:predicted porin